ncbi:LacI family DNA-binding transcriptional regulator [Micromonospora sp. WMMD1120]|uniref:LacI family DNA-binding transcriptional regulator n=1 Tax=Micromonospora sp. WMMD1120 TaxID=3016106 RepID=UPI002415E1BB|nr:LacI family DNA-binding transcriptional regulator [Micromonospora sp. WMMD1120]MDG4810735.1 LacI family DNA-binding transcriptional regulator [Micromonospora sp. WMMD1120]
MTAAHRPPVMADVARLAGVSHQTVSRVINGAPSIRRETRERVLEAIRRLDYRPNTAARALVRGRSGMIGIIGTARTLFGPTSIHRSVEDAARAAGYFATSVSLSEVTVRALSDATEHLMRVGVEGVVMIAGNDEALEVVRMTRSSVPFVVVEGDLSRASLTVGVDQVLGARMATEHLLDLGHREIVHVSGPLNWAEARARLDGWRQAMAAAGIRPPEPVPGDWHAHSGYAAGLRICDMPGATAVFAANDQMTIGVLRALHERGRRVPQDISVVGFDDVPEAAYLIPPLTTIQQDFAAVGQRAITAVTQAIDDSRPQPLPLVVPTLVVRRSTAPPSPTGT